jgi:hypothetical protein
MLAHSPPLPLIIDYSYANWDITAEEEERIIFALEQHDRVRRVRLQMPRISVPNLQKLVMAIDEEYPVLEYLILESPKKAALMLPETLQGPHLRRIVLTGFALPTGSQLLTTAVGLVTRTCYEPPIRLLPAKYSALMAFVHATAGDSFNGLFIPCFQPLCGEATHDYTDHDTCHAS